MFTWYTRNTRQKGASRQHRLTLTMLLPPQKVLLTVTQNKIQLIDLNVAALQKEKDQFKLCGQKLVVTGRDPIPVEINKGVVIRRCDLKTMQEEADVIMIQHMIAISEELDGAGIRVKCDDTDVFVLLLHFYRLREMACSLPWSLWPETGNALTLGQQQQTQGDNPKPLGSTRLIWM